MLKNPTCNIVTYTSSKPDGSPNAEKHGQKDGLRSDWLINYAEEAERYRLQVIGLQNFIKRTWQSRTQEGY